MFLSCEEGIFRLGSMMRKHRIFTDQALQPGQLIPLEDEVAHYLSRVLRVTAGQAVIVFNGGGSDYAAEVSLVTRAAVHLKLGSRLPSCAESPLHITLVQAVSRGERMDLSLQKATELGISALQPVFTARTEVRIPEDKMEKRMLHWRKVIISACEQSGRARLPVLFSPVDVLVWAQQASQAKRVMLAPGADPLACMFTGRALELLVGPEGGLEDSELEFMGRQGVVAASLGPRILRTETAGPAAIAIVQALAGDMGARRISSEPG